MRNQDLLSLFQRMDMRWMWEVLEDVDATRGKTVGEGVRWKHSCDRGNGLPTCEA